MLIRIFNVTVKKELEDEFIIEFEKIASYMRSNCEGLVSCKIGTPSKFTPQKYTMITTWQDELSLEKFTGKHWNKAIIPEHMKKYPISYEVEHFVVDS